MWAVSKYGQDTNDVFSTSKNNLTGILLVFCSADQRKILYTQCWGDIRFLALFS